MENYHYQHFIFYLSFARFLVIVALPENSYSWIFLTFFRRSVSLKSLAIVTAKENPE